MQYLLLIYVDEQVLADHPNRPALFAEYNQFLTELKASGAMRGSNRLQPVATATTVRVRDGKAQLTDGPFAETREQLGGYFLIEAKDLDEATRIAAKIPGARHGSIEIRPVFAM
jgi:hypothetical protein